jgi:hypothetical protein
MDERMIKSMGESAFKALEEVAQKYPDVKILFEDYKKLTTQERWSEDFLEGYWCCLSDLTWVKRHVG